MFLQVNGDYKMLINPSLNTWEDMDINSIEYAYEKISPIIADEYPNAKTRIKLKTLMEAFLPEYDIKCDEENNPPNLIDSGNIVVKVSTKKTLNGTYKYIDVIF